MISTTMLTFVALGLGLPRLLASPSPSCECAGGAPCRPLGLPPPARDVHVYSDCTSPGSEPCDWHATLNFSAIRTVVDGSKLGGPSRPRTLPLLVGVSF